MAVVHSLIATLWLIFIVYWAIAARSAKRNLDPTAWRRQLGVRIVLVLVIALAARNPAVRQALRELRPHETASIAMGVIGVIVVALGIGLAIFARVYLGRNWGMPMSRKENPELVTGGPYAVVRHPIYTGVLIAMLGSVLGQTALWALPLLLFGAYFIYCARREEELMCREFPTQYPAYMARTNMLVPFVL